MFPRLDFLENAVYSSPFPIFRELFKPLKFVTYIAPGEETHNTVKGADRAGRCVRKLWVGMDARNRRVGPRAVDRLPTGNDPALASAQLRHLAAHVHHGLAHWRLVVAHGDVGAGDVAQAQLALVVAAPAAHVPGVQQGAGVVAASDHVLDGPAHLRA